MYTVPCPKCPTLVTFERVAGLLRIDCGECGATIWSAAPRGGKDAFAPIPPKARKMTATATQDAPAKTRPMKPLTTDDTIGRKVTLTADERQKARDLLNW